FWKILYLVGVCVKPIGMDSTCSINDSIPIEKWLGWLLSALAISLGAQFWFDTLGKIISLRSSGAKPT
ncbi:MAG: hypothetical protein WCO00_18445, partial [Rhodospirillaceae bacterium]